MPDEDEPEELEVDPVEESARPRFAVPTFAVVADVSLLGDIADSVLLPLVDGEADEEATAATAAFTGFKMHLRTCRFKLDATPNRRPQVSQTNARGQNAEFEFPR